MVVVVVEGMVWFGVLRSVGIGIPRLGWEGGLKGKRNADGDLGRLGW